MQSRINWMLVLKQYKKVKADEVRKDEDKDVNFLENS